MIVIIFNLLISGRQRSYSFSHEKDVHYQQQQQQQHYLQQQMLQQQRTTMAGRSMPKRDRSYSESDVRWLQHREMGRELRRMSDEFVYERSRRPLVRSSNLWGFFFSNFGCFTPPPSPPPQSPPSPTFHSNVMSGFFRT